MSGEDVTVDLVSDTATSRAQLLEAAEVVRSALQQSRSVKSLRLFEYLLACALDDTSPTEAQIEEAVFSPYKIMGNGKDSNVRVYVHRLRKLIDAEFAARTGPKLNIPSGSYRICLVEEYPADTVAEIGPSTGWRFPVQGQGRRLSLWIAALAFGIVIGLGLLMARAALFGEPRLQQDFPWHAFDTGKRGVTIVMGDYFLFAPDAEAANERSDQVRLVWDPSVPTREDLTIYQILNPDVVSSAKTHHRQYVSSGTVSAVGAVRKALQGASWFGDREVTVIVASQLTPEILKSSDVIYVGQVGGIPELIRDPLRGASGFTFSRDINMLVEKGSDRRYESDGINLTDERIARRDYGYIASFPGPNDNQIVIIAGLRDPGVREMAEMVTKPEKLKKLPVVERSPHESFELLYRVRTMEEVNLGANMLISRPLRVDGIWDSSAEKSRYRPIEPGGISHPEQVK